MILHCCIHLKLGECHNTATFHNRQRAGPRLSSVQLKPALSAVTHCCDRCVYKSRCWHDVRDKMCRRKCSRRGKNKKSLFAHNRCGERSPFSWIVSPSPLRLHLCSIQWQDPKVFQEKKKKNRLLAPEICSATTITVRANHPCNHSAVCLEWHVEIITSGWDSMEETII